jgi:hypothetical protein
MEAPKSYKQIWAELELELIKQEAQHNQKWAFLEWRQRALDAEEKLEQIYEIINRA